MEDVNSLRQAGEMLIQASFTMNEEEDYGFSPELLSLGLVLLEYANEEDEEQRKPRVKRNRRVLQLTWENSFFHLEYVLNANNYNRFGTPHTQKLFRDRFRMCHESYRKIVAMLKDEPDFASYKNTDASGRQASSLDVLVLGALSVIGRGVIYDDLLSGTYIAK